MTRHDGPRLGPEPPRNAQEALAGHGIARVLEGRPMLLARAEGGAELWLDVLLQFSDGCEVPTALLLDVCDPYELAGELLGVADELVRQVALDHQADAQEERELLRRMRLKAKRRREEVALQVRASGATSCDMDGCQRSVAFIVEDTKLCKRHAEELGVRPHGKVGEPDPEELPGEAES